MKDHRRTIYYEECIIDTRAGGVEERGKVLMAKTCEWLENGTAPRCVGGGRDKDVSWSTRGVVTREAGGWAELFPSSLLP